MGHVQPQAIADGCCPSKFRRGYTKEKKSSSLSSHEMASCSSSLDSSPLPPPIAWGIPPAPLFRRFLCTTFRARRRLTYRSRSVTLNPPRATLAGLRPPGANFGKLSILHSQQLANSDRVLLQRCANVSGRQLNCQIQQARVSERCAKYGALLCANHSAPTPSPTTTVPRHRNRSTQRIPPTKPKVVRHGRRLRASHHLREGPVGSFPPVRDVVASAAVGSLRDPRSPRQFPPAYIIFRSLERGLLLVFCRSSEREKKKKEKKNLRMAGQLASPLAARTQEEAWE